MIAVFSFAGAEWTKLSFGMGGDIFEFLDYITANIMLPLGGLFISIFVGWVMKKEIVKEELLSKFKSKNNNIFLFYKYYLEKFKNEEPLNIITKIIDTYEKIKDDDTHTSFPRYIDELFYDIKSSIKKKNEEKQLEILKNYTNKQTFMEEITYNLKEAINNYLS